MTILPFLVWQSSLVPFLWVLHVQFIQHTVKQSKQEQLLAQMANLTTMTENSIISFFNTHHLCSKLLPPGADVSHYYENP